MPRSCHRCGNSLSGDVASCPNCGTAIRPAFAAAVAADDEIETVVERVLTPMPVPLRGSRGEDPNDQTIRGRNEIVSPSPQPDPLPQDIPTVKTPILSMTDIARLKEEFASTVPRSKEVGGVWTGEDTQPIMINSYESQQPPVAAVPVSMPPARKTRRNARLLAVAAIIFVTLGAVAFGISRFLRQPARPAVVQKREVPAVTPVIPVPAPDTSAAIDSAATETAPPSDQLAEVLPLIEEIPSAEAPKPVVRQPVRPTTRRRTPPQKAAASPVVPVSQTPPPIVVKEGDLAQLGDSGLVPPQLSQDVEPKYPVRARMSGAGGRVELQLLIDHHGVVERVEMGRTSGNSLLDNSAIIAAKRSRFRPATRQGVPVKIWITRTYNFRPNS